MLFDFFAHLNSNDMNDYLNGYSTFLMTNKDLRENILYHRMNVLINAYLNDKRIGNKCDYLSYYMNNYKDGYLDREFIKDLYKSIDTTAIHEFDGDVIDHYRFITSKPPPEPEIDYDEIDKKFYEEELLKKKESEREVVFDDEIDEDYDDYDYEYYNNDDYDDIEELDDYTY